ncbi:YolD-like family protein [Metabacillus arenae]|uniref:YolD-like family protein n=1 Tax=Metabacillus arenae TaxID=2771434 RepID=A0A926RW19_9BACI|nr:YolD-like family protein [Metabacillus arenae]MBD1378737.1 YolD-like family protein [Metabacillus arenae]
MIRDRGNIKWTSMMLPEHVKLLREWKEEERYQTKPALDEQQLEEFNEIICNAMEFHHPLQFKYYDKHQFHHCTGHVHYIDTIKQTIRIVTENDERIDLPFQDIVHIEAK